MYVGIDIGGTKTAVLLTDADLNICAQSEQPTDAHALVANLNNAVDQVLTTAQITPQALLGIGIGIPGMVDPRRGVVSQAINLQIERPLPLVKMMRENFPVPIALENDVRLAAVGVHKRLGIDNIAYLNIGTGISAGVVLDGRLHRGVTGMAGEIGHIPINDSQDILENLISGPAMVRQAKSRGLSIDHAGELYRLAGKNDPQANAVIKKVSATIGQAILWLVMVYDIEKLVLGGGVTRSGDAFLAPVLAELARMRQYSQLARLMAPDSKVDLLLDNLNAGAWGAVHLAQETTQKIAQRKNNYQPTTSGENT